jgi:hypothetical protein
MTSAACVPVRAMLPLFVGGDLEPAPAKAVRDHLRACAPCRREAGSLLQAVRGLRRAAEADPVPGVDDAMFARLHDRVMQRVEQMGPAPRRAAFWTLLRRAGVVAAAAALVLGGFWLSGQGGGLLQRPAIRADGVAAGSSPGLQHLGHEDRQAAVEPAGLGLMGRLSLRTLEDEQVVLERPFDGSAGRSTDPAPSRRAPR